jgi:hypothetical protein
MDRVTAYRVGLPLPDVGSHATSRVTGELCCNATMTMTFWSQCAWLRLEMDTR